ncbi:Calcium-dependent protein kinase 15 [Asimina triloba]
MGKPSVAIPCLRHLLHSLDFTSCRPLYLMQPNHPPSNSQLCYHHKKSNLPGCDCLMGLIDDKTNSHFRLHPLYELDDAFAERKFFKGWTPVPVVQPIAPGFGHAILGLLVATTHPPHNSHPTPLPPLLINMPFAPPHHTTPPPFFICSSCCPGEIEIVRPPFEQMESFGALKKIALASFTCIFALVGACVGVVTGAITGQTTETGFLRGAGIGAVSGAILSVELFESLIKGDTLSKIAMFGSLVNGKIFPEWVSPAMLKAYQWQVGRPFTRAICTFVQNDWLIRSGPCDPSFIATELISMLESNHIDESDIFDVSSNSGVTLEFVKKLPHFRISRSNTSVDSCCGADCCAVCLQKKRESKERKAVIKKKSLG